MSDSWECMIMPTPCPCGRVVELNDMVDVHGELRCVECQRHHLEMNGEMNGDDDLCTCNECFDLWAEGDLRV